MIDSQSAFHKSLFEIQTCERFSINAGLRVTWLGRLVFRLSHIVSLLSASHLLGILSEKRLQRLQRHLLMKRDLSNIFQEDKTDHTIEGFFVVGHHL